MAGIADLRALVICVGAVAIPQASGDYPAQA